MGKTALYRTSDNICVANFHVINFRVKKLFVEADGQRKFFNTKTFLHMHVVVSFKKLKA